MVEHIGSAWQRIVPFTGKSRESDPGFRDEIRRLTQRGLTVAALLATVSVTLFLTSYLFVNKPVSWTYGVPRSIVLWDELLILVVSVAVLMVARQSWAAEWGRLVMAILIVVISIAMMIEDIARADADFSTAVLSLALIVAVGTVPFRAAQTFALGLSVSLTFVLCMGFASQAMGTRITGFDTSRTVYMVVLTCLLAGISELLHRSRYEQYRAFRDLKLTQAQLIHSEKMASLGQLAAGIAHEMKNPLNFINNFAELNTQLAEDVAKIVRRRTGDLTDADIDQFEKTMAYLRLNNQKIEEHGKRADGIVRSMMLHARGASSERRSVKLNALVEEHVNLAHSGIRSRRPDFSIEIVKDYADNTGEVNVAPQELGRVLINLLTNAFDAVLDEASRNGAYLPTVRISTRRIRDGVEIRISDNGAGIPASVLPKIFDPFFTTKPVGHGTGLGLSISYDIVVHGHGGQLYVESDNRDGATFVVVLPVTLPEETIVDRQLAGRAQS